MACDPIVFLDIDGVLNCKLEIDRRINNNEKLGTSLISEQCVRAFEQVISKVPTVKLVISSTWRYKFKNGYDKPDVFEGKLWSDYIGATIASRIVDQTSRTKANYCRGNDIHRWLKNNEHGNWVIIDDDQDMLDYQIPNLVLTDWENGFTEQHISKVVEILNARYSDD